MTSEFCNLEVMKVNLTLSKLTSHYQSYPFWQYLDKFTFNNTTKAEIEKIIKDLNTTKSQTTTDIPVKIIKEYSDIFSDFLSTAINESFETLSFPDLLKFADITPVYKRKGSKILDQSVYSRYYQKYMKGSFMIR